MSLKPNGLSLLDIIYLYGNDMEQSVNKVQIEQIKKGTVKIEISARF
jgi:hypothetical protein